MIKDISLIIIGVLLGIVSFVTFVSVCAQKLGDIEISEDDEQIDI